MQEAYLTNGTMQDEMPCPEVHAPEGVDPDKWRKDAVKLWRKAARLAVAGMRHLPGPKTGGVEGEFEFSADQMRFRGFMDYNGSSEKLPNFHTPNGVVIPVALDHKTSSDPSKYGLWGKEAFLNDPQAVVYAYKLLMETGAALVGLRWVYYWTKTKEKTLPSDVVLTREEVLAAWQSLIVPMARHQQLLAGQIPAFVDLTATADWAQRIVPNPHKCANYGGCEYRKITETERAEAASKDKRVHPYRGVCVLTDSEQAIADLAGLNDIIPTESLTRKVSPKMANAPDLFQALQGAFAGNGNGAKQAVLNPPEAPAPVAVEKGPDLMAFLRTAQGSDVAVVTTAAPVPPPPKKPSVRPPAPVAVKAAPPPVVKAVATPSPTTFVDAGKVYPPAPVVAVEAAEKASVGGAYTQAMTEAYSDAQFTPAPDTSFPFGANAPAEPRHVIETAYVAERIAIELSTELHLTPAQVVDRAYEIAQLMSARFSKAGK